MSKFHSKSFIIPLICVFLLWIIPQPIQADYDNDAEEIEDSQKTANILLIIAGVIVIALTVGFIVNSVKSTTKYSKLGKSLESNSKPKQALSDSLSNVQPDSLNN